MAKFEVKSGSEKNPSKRTIGMNLNLEKEEDADMNAAIALICLKSNITASEFLRQCVEHCLSDIK